MKRGIFVANDGGETGCVASRIFGTVDEADDVAIVEVAEAVNLIGDEHVVSEAFHDVRGKLEA